MDACREAPKILKLLETFDWWKLKPDVKHEFVTEGYGQWKEADYVTAALAEDGSCGLVYLPGQQTIKVDLGRFSKPVQAFWFDPTNGALKRVAGRTAESNKEAFTPPGQNVAREPDWILLFKAN